MPSSAPPSLQLVLTAAVTAWMAGGFLPGRSRWTRWARWTMFCHATFTLTTLNGHRRSDGRVEPVNVYAHLPEGTVALHPTRLQALLTHLTSATGPYGRVDGHGRVLSGAGERSIEVRDSRVVG